MKFDKIVAFGDSWVWGDELLDPELQHRSDAHPILVENTPYREQHCFLGQLGKHYGVTTENFGWPGASIQSSIWCYLWWWQNETVDRTRCLVLVAHTDAGRTSFFNPGHTRYDNDPPWHRFVHSAWIHSGATSVAPEWHHMVQQHHVLTDCSEYHLLNFRQGVLFFEGQNQLLGGNLLQFSSLIPPEAGVATSLIWPGKSLVSMLNQRSDRSSILAKKGHPNELGHQIIKDLLIDEIDRVILSE